MTKEFTRILPNNSGKNSFVTHEEFTLFYVDIKGDIQSMDRKFSSEIIHVRRDICDLDEKFTAEFKKTREEAHRELIEVKNELKGDIVKLQVDTAELKGDVTQLKADVEEIKGDITQLKADVAELKTDVAELKADVSMIKEYLFTKLASDIRSIVKECLAEERAVSHMSH